MEKSHSSLLTPPLKSRLVALGPQKFCDHILKGFDAVGTDDFSHQVARDLIFAVFIHITKDETVVSEYLPILGNLANEYDNIRMLLSRSIEHQGKCPKSARSAVRSILDEIERKMGSSAATNLLDTILESPTTSISNFSIVTEAISSLRSSINVVKLECAECLVDDLHYSLELDGPRSPGFYNGLSNEEIHRYLEVTKHYLLRGSEPVSKHYFAEYCFAKAWKLHQQNEKREARTYLRVFLLLYNRMLSDVQQYMRWQLYNAIAMYFRTYNLYVDLRSYASATLAEKLYNSLIYRIALLSDKAQLEALGRSVLEMNILYPSIISDHINRMKTGRVDATRQIAVLAKSLAQPRVFIADPLETLRLLERIDKSFISIAASQISPANPEQRRLLAVSLIIFAKSTPLEPFNILESFPQNTSPEAKRSLAFALLVEPSILPVTANDLKPENLLKAKLATAALGFNAGTQASEYFQANAERFATLFDRFARSVDPNQKGGYGFNILNDVRTSRKFLLTELRERLRDDFRILIKDFFNSIEGYVTAEQSKLILNTELELKLVSHRVLYVPTHTRITIEIRNSGEGMAEALKLEVFPIEEMYQVEDRYRIYEKDFLASKAIWQVDIFIQPLKNPQDSLDLSMVLQFDTPREKGKLAELLESNTTISFYSETQFVRIPQPYNLEPATTWFVGRQDLLETILDNLHFESQHDNSIVVYGLKRAGKTSVVKRFITHMLPNRDVEKMYITAYIDLLTEPVSNSIRSNQDFLAFLMKIIVNALPSTIRRDKLSLNLEAFAKDFEQNAFETFTFLLEEILKSVYPSKLLLVLDEFSTISKLVHPDDTGRSAISAEVFGFLGNTLQSTNQLVLIFTGTYILFTMMREYGYDLFKVCSPYLVGFLDDNAARRLVQDPVAYNPEKPDQGWLEYDSRVVDRIVTVTNCHPYLIQYICMKLVDKMNTAKQNSVNLNDVESLLSEIISHPRHEIVFLPLWQEFDISQQRVLAVISAKSNAPGSPIETDEIIRTLEQMGDPTPADDIMQVCSSLVDAELLEKSSLGENEGYRITIPLYQDWLKKNKSLNRIFRG